MCNKAAAGACGGAARDEMGGKEMGRALPFGMGREDVSACGGGGSRGRKQIH